MSSEICVPHRFQRLKLANFGIFARYIDMDKYCEVTPMVSTYVVTFSRCGPLDEDHNVSFLTVGESGVKSNTGQLKQWA